MACWCCFKSLWFWSLKYFQGQIVADRVMSQVIEEGMLYRGSIGKLVVITGASHVAYGSRGTGLPARVQKKLTKRTQAVVLLNPDDNWNKADHLGAVEHPSLVQPQSRNKSHQACSDSIASTLQKHNILMRSPRNQQPLFLVEFDALQPRISVFEEQFSSRSSAWDRGGSREGRRDLEPGQL